MSSFMNDNGIHTPDIRHLREGSPAEICSALEAMGLPAVVKGATGQGGEQVRIVESHEEAVRVVTEMSLSTDALPAIQEYVDGPTYQVGGIFDRGRAVQLVAGRKTQMVPPRTGPAIALRSVREAELTDATARVFSALGYSGIAGADFIRGTDGRFRFLEVNPRIWGSWDFARALGQDLFGVWIRQVRGEPLPAPTSHALDRQWAKMPEYLFSPPGTRTSILRRAVHPVAIKSWSWHNRYILIHQLRRAYWRFME
jgi:biotin carboxylase